MSDAGFFKGTSTEQDSRFSNAQKKMMKTMRFADGIDRKVDMEKINLDLIKPWIAKRLMDILDVDDDVVVEFAMNQLEEKHPDPKLMQINMTGFLGGQSARIFIGQLWDLLASAQETEDGIPPELVEMKIQELKDQKEANDRLRERIRQKEEEIRKAVFKQRDESGKDDDKSEEGEIRGDPEYEDNEHRYDSRRIGNAYRHSSNDRYNRNQSRDRRRTYGRRDEHRRHDGRDESRRGRCHYSDRRRRSKSSGRRDHKSRISPLRSRENSQQSRYADRNQGSSRNYSRGDDSNKRANSIRKSSVNHRREDDYTSITGRASRRSVESGRRSPYGSAEPKRHSRRNDYRETGRDDRRESKGRTTKSGDILKMKKQKSRTPNACNSGERDSNSRTRKDKKNRKCREDKKEQSSSDEDEPPLKKILEQERGGRGPTSKSPVIVIASPTKIVSAKGEHDHSKDGSHEDIEMGSDGMQRIIESPATRRSRCGASKDGIVTNGSDRDDSFGGKQNNVDRNRSEEVLSDRSSRDYSRSRRRYRGQESSERGGQPSRGDHSRGYERRDRQKENDVRRSYSADRLRDRHSRERYRVNAYQNSSYGRRDDNRRTRRHNAYPEDECGRYARRNIRASRSPYSRYDVHEPSRADLPPRTQVRLQSHEPSPVRREVKNSSPEPDCDRPSRGSCEPKKVTTDLKQLSINPIEHTQESRAKGARDNTDLEECQGSDDADEVTYKSRKRRPNGDYATEKRKDKKSKKKRNHDNKGKKRSKRGYSDQSLSSSSESSGDESTSVTEAPIANEDSKRKRKQHKTKIKSSSSKHKHRHSEHKSSRKSKTDSDRHESDKRHRTKKKSCHVDNKSAGSSSDACSDGERKRRKSKQKKRSSKHHRKQSTVRSSADLSDQTPVSTPDGERRLREEALKSMKLRQLGRCRASTSSDGGN